MPPRRMALVDAFSTEPLAGNAAGVVPDADGLTDEQCQAVARELSVSETAFLFDSTEADRRIRYFTPTQEVELCGHATIGAHAWLDAEDALDAGSHSLETNVGVLDIELTDDGTVWMTQETPTVEPREIPYHRLAEALGVEKATLQDVGAELPVARASTGLPFLIIPINFLESLGSITPDLRAIEALSEEHDVAGIYVFTFDTLSGDSTLHARMFAPAAGVDEDPVTGTASGACGAYLHDVGAAAFDEPPEAMAFEQGHFIDRAGLVEVRVGLDERGQREVRVGGQAVVSLTGEIEIPEYEEDGIIEA